MTINKSAYIKREDIMKLQKYKLAEGCDEIFVCRDDVLELIDFADDPDTMMDDTISRQVVIEAISTMFAPTPTMKDMVEDCLEIIDNLPSAQSEIIHCAECVHWKHSDVRKNYCDVFDWINTAEDFCSFAERRTDDKR